MKRTLHQFITRLALFATTLGLVMGPGMVARAQTGASLGTRVSPPSFDLTLGPGETISKTIEIQNNSSVTQTYNLTTNGFTAAGEEGGAAFLPATSGDLSGWITFNPPRSLSVPPNGTGTVEVEIAVPDNASPGGHYATIFARTDNEDTEATGVGVQQMIGVNFLVRVAGNIIENASVVEFSTPKGRLEPGEELMFTTRVRNTGNVHIRPSGVVEIYRGNAKIHEIAVNEEGGAVLPDSVRRYTVESSKYLPAGKYQAGLVLQYGASQVIQVPPVEFVVVNENLFVMVVIASLIILAIILIIALVVNRRPSTDMKSKK